MTKKQELKQMLYEVVDEFNDQMGMNNQIKKVEDEILFGEKGSLDSLGLVNLITLIEESIEDELDIVISLADEKAMARKTSPFRTLGHLFEYVNDLLEAHPHG